MMLKIRYQIETNDNVNASATCAEMASMFKQMNLQNQPTAVMNELHDDIELLVERFININVDSSLLLQSCRFDLIVGFFDGKSRLDKLERIGFKMQLIAKELKEQNKCIDFKEQYQFMDKIWKEMQRINDVDLKVKLKQIAFFLHYYGYCCIQINDNDKSIDIYKQAISFMKNAFGDDAHHHCVLSLCYHNLGTSYKNSKKLLEARQWYETALESDKLAKDHPSETAKLESILHTTRSLQNVDALLKNYM